jgi:uncharacterized membrane protein YeaQ/YmgE (transglycosylase-associated protein family)
MAAPLIGMTFLSFLILLFISAFATIIVHSGIRYRFLNGADGFFGKWILAWIFAWLGPAVLGHWFGPVMLWNIYIISALVAAFCGAFVPTVVLRAATKVRRDSELAVHPFEHHEAA